MDFNFEEGGGKGEGVWGVGGWGGGVVVGGMETSLALLASPQQSQRTKENYEIFSFCLCLFAANSVWRRHQAARPPGGRHSVRLDDQHLVGVRRRRQISRRRRAARHAQSRWLDFQSGASASLRAVAPIVVDSSLCFVFVLFLL